MLKRASARNAEGRLSLGTAHTDGGYVAVNEAGKPYTPDSLTRMWIKTTKAAGMRPIRLHDARHSCGTALHLRGVPLAIIAKWLGHADASTRPASRRSPRTMRCAPPDRLWAQL